MSFQWPNLGLFGGFEKCETSDILDRLNQNFELLDFLGGDVAIEGRVADFASLPSSPTTGDIYITDDTNSIWYFTDVFTEFIPFAGLGAFNKSDNSLLNFNGTAWVVVSNETPEFVRPRYNVKFPIAPGDGAGPVYTALADEQVIYIRGSYSEVQLPATPLIGKHYLVIGDSAVDVKIGTFTLASLTSSQSALCVYVDSTFGWAAFTSSTGTGVVTNALSAKADSSINSFTSGVQNQVGWNTINGDLSFVSSPVTISGRVNITKTSTYLVSAQITYALSNWGTGTGNYGELEIHVNGSKVAVGPKAFAQGTIENTVFIMPYRLELTAGDFVEIFQFQNSGFSKTPNQGADSASLSFMNIVEVI